MKTLVTAAVLLTLTTPGHAAPKGEWFLIFDIWLCDVHDCGEGKHRMRIMSARKPSLLRSSALPKFIALSKLLAISPIRR